MSEVQGVLERRTLWWFAFRRLIVSRQRARVGLVPDWIKSVRVGQVILCTKTIVVEAVFCRLPDKGPSH